MGRFSNQIRQAGTALVVVFAIGFIGCTRESKDTSSVRLSIPAAKSQKIGTLSQDLNVIIVNVTYPGMAQPVFFEWSAHSCPVNATCAPPSQVNFEVPKGADRLIQVLAVYEDESTGQMTFKYGDVQKSLMNASEEVSITVATIGSAGMQAHISGRYMDASAGGGPTGMVVGKFDPGNGKPPMAVIRSFMFAGWFTNLMAMDGTSKFSYYLNGDQPLFTELNISSSVLAGSNQVVRINAPQRDREQHNGGVATWETEAAGKMIFGYFGPGAGTNKACYDQRTNIDIEGLRLPTTSTVMKWGGASPSANQVGVESGGVAYDPSTNNSEPCEIAGTAFSTHMDFKYDQLRNGHDSVTGFRSVFKGAISNGQLQYVAQTHNSGAATLTLDLDYLPGVTVGPARIQGISAFRRPVVGGGGDDLHGGGGDGIDCNRLSSLGFVSAGADYVIASGATTGSMVLNNFASLSNTQLVLCPYLDAGAAGKFYPPAGLEVWLDSGGMPQNSLSLKIIGRDYSNSNLEGPSLGATVPPMHKNAFLNSHYNFAVTAGTASLNASDILSAEASLDGGTTWTPVYVHDQTYGTRNVVIVPVINSTTMSPVQDDLWQMIPSSADNDLKIRVTVTNAIKTAKGLASEVYTSPTMTLLGTGGACASSPGTLELVDMSGPVTITGANLLAAFTGGGSTDEVKSLRLRWSNCPAAFAPLDQVVLQSMSTSPNGCFDKSDIEVDPTDSFLFHFSPKDRMGVDCTLSGGLGHILFAAPSSAWADSYDVSFSSATITHSTTTSRLGFLATPIGSLASVSERLMHTLSMFGGSISFKAGAINLNSDGKVTSTSTPGVASGSTAWDFGVLSTSFSGAAPTGTNLFNVGTVTTPTAKPVANLMAADGATTGGFPILVQSASVKVLDSSRGGFDGGSPLMLIDDGVYLALAFIPSNNGNYVGKSLKILALPNDISFPQAPNYAKLIQFNYNGKNQVFVAARYGTSSKYAFGIFDGHGESMTVNWAPSNSFGSEAVYGADIDMSGSPRIIIGQNISSAVVSHPIPTWNGSVWTGTAKTNTNAAATAVTTGLSLVRCGNELWVAGRDGGNEWTAEQITNMTSPIVGNTVGIATDISSATKVSCLGIDDGSGFPARVFMAYNEASTTNNVFSYRGSSGSACGTGTSNASMSGLSTISVTADSGGLMSVLPANAPGGQGFLVAYAGGGFPTKLSFVPVSCTSNVVSASGASMWGGLGMTAAQIKGMSPILNGPGPGAGPPPSLQHVNDFAVYGDSSQFYWLTGR